MEMASFVVPGANRDAELEWSPNSRRLAVAKGLQTFVYDLETSRTVRVKTWRPAWVLHHIAWTPDSRSFYFARSVAVFFGGVEIMRVTLRD